jgi:hypothetical protein
MFLRLRVVIYIRFLISLTTHHHLVPRSWMSRSYTSSPPCAFVARSGLLLLNFRIILSWIFTFFTHSISPHLFSSSPLSHLPFTYSFYFIFYFPSVPPARPFRLMSLSYPFLVYYSPYFLTIVLVGRPSAVIVGQACWRNQLITLWQVASRKLYGCLPLGVVRYWYLFSGLRNRSVLFLATKFKQTIRGDIPELGVDQSKTSLFS